MQTAAYNSLRFAARAPCNTADLNDNDLRPVRRIRHHTHIQPSGKSSVPLTVPSTTAEYPLVTERFTTCGTDVHSTRLVEDNVPHSLRERDRRSRLYYAGHILRDSSLGILQCAEAMFPTDVSQRSSPKGTLARSVLCAQFAYLPHVLPAGYSLVTFDAGNVGSMSYLHFIPIPQTKMASKEGRDMSALTMVAIE
jgi:hypothetical protein